MGPVRPTCRGSQPRSRSSVLLRVLPIGMRFANTGQILDDPLCRLAVLFGRDRAFFPLPCH